MKQAQGTAALRKDRAELDLEWLGFLLYMFMQQMFYLRYFYIYNFKWITHLFHNKQQVRHDLAFPWFLSSCWGHQNLILGEGDPSRASLPTPIPGSATLLRGAAFYSQCFLVLPQTGLLISLHDIINLVVSTVSDVLWQEN